jgi:very-short-patch-repair endonuclease
MFEKFKKIHNNEYDYDEDSYVNLSTYFNVICKTHGKFSVLGQTHAEGGGKCPKCKLIKKIKPKRLKNFLKENLRQRLFVYRHGNKYYPCEIHGEVLVGKNRNFIDGCPNCNIENYNNSLPVFATYEVAKKRVNDLGITSESQYIKWKKRTCQNDLPSKLYKTYKGKGWISYYEFFNTKKNDRMSIGEKRIYNYLKKNKYSFVMQKKFSDCKNIHCLRFDFYLEDYNVIIEFDGQQHFKMANFSTSVEENKKNFECLQKNDKIKNEYCKKNGIILLRFNDYHLDRNILEWEIDNELTKIRAELAIKSFQDM